MSPICLGLQLSSNSYFVGCCKVWIGSQNISLLVSVLFDDKTPVYH